MAITEDYVSFETAKLLKEKGFKGECFADYNGNGKLYKFDEEVDDNTPYWSEAPTLQMAMKWLREVYNIYLDIHITNHSISNMVDIIKYYWVAVSAEDAKWITESTARNVAGFKTYNEATEDAIKYCLENLI